LEKNKKSLCQLRLMLCGMGSEVNKFKGFRDINIRNEKS
jgi:hypothetical protein